MHDDSFTFRIIVSVSEVNMSRVNIKYYRELHGNILHGEVRLQLDRFQNTLSADSR